ncbi:MAG: folate-binding protein [Roseinatronobacter sp.]|nr:folate-binding protein [Roseinatronobacter sp.]
MTRAIIEVSGQDASKFLQGLVTNDLRKLERDGIVYAAFLSPQGKYLADFFLVARPDGVIWIDVAPPIAAELLRRLAAFKLRAQVSLTPLDIAVSRGTGPAPAGALPDPRHPALGWRLYGQALPDDGTDWDALRVAHCIPESGIELLPNETFILEAGFERLHGVDFRKGCYVGQEVTARMQHKTSLRKGLVTVGIEGCAPVGAEIVAAGKPAGQVFTQAGNKAIAYLRFDRASAEMQADSARLFWQAEAEPA